jgi:hypothetical protein
VHPFVFIIILIIRVLADVADFLRTIGGKYPAVMGIMMKGYRNEYHCKEFRQNVSDFFTVVLELTTHKGVVNTNATLVPFSKKDLYFCLL